MKYDGYEVSVKVNAYLDKSLYVGLDYYDKEMGCMLPYGDITVNTEDRLGYLKAAVDINNMGTNVLSFLEEYGLAFDTGERVYSGFCTYPVYEFLEKRLFELCPMEFAKYKRLQKR